MSKSLPAPWLRDWGMSLLNESIVQVNSNNGEQKTTKVPKKYKASSLKSRMVQVIGVDTEWNTLTINDKSTQMTAMLTDKCFQAVLSEFESLDDLTNSIVTLNASSYHMSTVYQCAGTRDVKKMRGGRGLTLPLALQVSSVSFTGASDCDVFTEKDGEMPMDLNHDQGIRETLKKLTYMSMVAKFGALQFPDQGYLPDANGVFDIAPRFSEATEAVNPLLPVLTNVETVQQSMLDKIGTYDRVRIVELVSLADKSLMANIANEDGDGNYQQVSGVSGTSSPKAKAAPSSQKKRQKSPAVSVNVGEGRELTRAERDTLLFSVVGSIAQKKQIASPAHVVVAPATAAASSSTGVVVPAAVSSSSSSPAAAAAAAAAAAPVPSPTPFQALVLFSGSSPTKLTHRQLPGTLLTFDHPCPEVIEGDGQCKARWTSALSPLYPALAKVNTNYVWLQVWVAVEYPGRMVIYRDEQDARDAKAAVPAAHMDPHGSKHYTDDQWNFQLREPRHVRKTRGNVLMDLPLHLVKDVRLTQKLDRNKGGHRVKLTMKSADELPPHVAAAAAADDEEANGVLSQLRFGTESKANNWVKALVDWINFAELRDEWAEMNRELVRAHCTKADSAAVSTSAGGGGDAGSVVRRGRSPSSASSVGSGSGSNRKQGRAMLGSSSSSSQSGSEELQPQTQAAVESQSQTMWGTAPPPSAALMTEENLAAEEMWFNGGMAQQTAPTQPVLSALTQPATQQGGSVGRVRNQSSSSSDVPSQSQSRSRSRSPSKAAAAARPAPQSPPKAVASPKRSVEASPHDNAHADTQQEIIMEELADVLGDDDSALDTSAVAAKRRTRLSMDDEDSPPSTSEDISQGLVKRGPGRPKSAGKKKTPSPSQKKGKEVVNGSSRTSRSSKSPLESHDVSPADTSRANRSARKEKKEETKEDESKKASSAKMSAQKVKTKGVNLNGDEEGMDKTLIGVNIRKNFPGMGVFAGTVISYDNPYYRVKYLADDDEEEMEPSEIANYRIDKEVEGQFTQAIGGSARDEEPEEMQYDDDKRGDTRGDKDDSEPVEPMLQRRSSRSSSSSASVLSSSATKGYSVRRSSRGQSTSAKKRKSWVEQDTVEEEEEEEELVVPMKTSTSASSAAQKEKNGRRRSLSSSRSRSDDSDESHIESPEAVSAPVPAARAASSSERPSTGDKRSSIKKTPRTKSGDNDEGDVSGRERGGLDVALSLDKRRQSLGRLPASEREALDAESLEIAHGLIATNLQSPKPPSSQQSVQDNRSRSTRKAVRDHIYSIPKGRMPHESIWVHMTNAEKAPFLEERGRFVQEKRRLAIEGDRQKSLALSEEDTYQNIKEQICRASEIQALLKEASDIEDKSERKVANRKVRAIIADKATSLLDQGYTATKGALFGPSGSTSASSSSYKAAAASSSSSGSSSSVKSASAAKRARMWDQEDQEEEESVNTQPGGDVYYPDSTALQDPIGDNYSNLSGSDGDEKEKENKGSRRLSGSSSWNQSQSQSQRGTDTKKRVAESQESYRSAISLGSSGKKRRGSGIGSAQRNVQQPRVFSSSRGGSPFSQSRPFSRAGSSSTKKRGAEALEPAAAPAPAVSAAEEHRLKMLEISQRNLAKKSRRVRL